MKKKKHNYEISIPNQPDPGYKNWRPFNGPTKLGPLEDERKRKQRFERLNALKNKHPKK